VETRRGIGLNALLHCVRKLVEMNKLQPDESERLNMALGDLINETAYDKIDFESREAISVSLVRAECVRLARALEDRGTATIYTATWLSGAEGDPLPEVRYALDNMG
jgi:CRISPR/Cas system-associated exonuclease Cas4 (RecB family)